MILGVKISVERPGAKNEEKMAWSKAKREFFHCKYGRKDNI